ncbi:hypothetical protein ACQ4PT_027454 [Festuca glaucescens]
MGRGDTFVRDAADTLRGWVRESGGCLVVDGAMGTELEAHGADLQDELWSARCLVSAPHLIRKVHLDYLEAGANIITTASYQATLQGFQSRGLSREQSEALLRRGVQVAQEARAIFLEGRSKGPYAARENNDGSTERRPVLVAASVGSYGAYLADGSEYTGDYGRSVTKEALKKFHRAGPHRLRDHPEQAGGAGLLRAPGGERHTDPSLVLLHLQGRSQRGERGPHHPLRRRRRLLQEGRRRRGKLHRSQADQWTAPRHQKVRVCTVLQVTSKPIVVYPNTGETYVAETKEWVVSALATHPHMQVLRSIWFCDASPPVVGVLQDSAGGGASATDFVSCVGKWRQAGASLVGGCCRTSPATVRAIARALRDSDAAAADIDGYDDFQAVAVL